MISICCVGDGSNNPWMSYVPLACIYIAIYSFLLGRLIARMYTNENEKKRVCACMRICDAGKIMKNLIKQNTDH